jgi:hypothetical protein
MNILCDRIYMHLFVACTNITLGNGQRDFFWTDRWLNGLAPEEIASLVFALARRKHLNVVVQGQLALYLDRVKCCT